MRSTVKSFVCPVAAVALAWAAAGRAEATPMQLSLTAHDVTTNTFFTSVFTDSITANQISVPTGTQGDIHFTGEFSQSIIAGTTGALTTSATTIENKSLTDTYVLTAAVSGMNFTGPDDVVSATASGTWLGNDGSKISLAFYDDPSNVLGAQCTTVSPQCAPLTHPGNSVFTFTSPAASGPTSSYDFNPGTAKLAVPDGALYSMTETWTYTLLPNSELTSRGQTETKTLAPEPVSLSILGLGLLGLGLLRYRRGPAR